jgi:uncharacterized protein
MEAWQTNLVESQTAIEAILRDTRTIAVLGIKPESHAWAPAHFVPAYLLRAGFDVIPVPVYYPDVQVILGLPVVRKLEEIDRPIDMVNVFRRSTDIPPHVESLLTVKPKCVWFQSGIRNDAAAERLARAGIKVVQDRCLMVEHSG